MSNTYDNYWKKIPTTHGFILFGALVGFFLLMRAIGVAENHYLRIANIALVLIVIWASIRKYGKRSGYSFYDKFSSFFAVGARVTFIGVALFAVFMALYLDLIDEELMAALSRKNAPGGWGIKITSVNAAFFVFLEGMLSGLAITFIICQLYKFRTVEEPAESKKELRDEQKRHPKG